MRGGEGSFTCSLLSSPSQKRMDQERKRPYTSPGGAVGDFIHYPASRPSCGHELFPGSLLTRQTPLGNPGPPRRESYVLHTHLTSPPPRLAATATWIVCSVLQTRTPAQAERGNHSWRAIDTQTSTGAVFLSFLFVWVLFLFCGSLEELGGSLMSQPRAGELPDVGQGPGQVLGTLET